MLRVALVKGLLTRVETVYSDDGNTVDTASSCFKGSCTVNNEGNRSENIESIRVPTIDNQITTVYIYNHGFPDASVQAPGNLGIPNPLPSAGTDIVREHMSLACGAEVKKTHLLKRLIAANSNRDGIADYFASRMPRKLRDSLLYSNSSEVDLCDNSAKINSERECAFVCFNTNGIKGSYGRFRDKTLEKDMMDIHTIVEFCENCFVNARIIIIGLSTGALLSFAYCSTSCRLSYWNMRSLSSSAVTGAPNEHTNHQRIVGCIAIACVDDIPTSFELDFSSGQLHDFSSKGFCYVETYDHGKRIERQLNTAYLQSYSFFPDGASIVEGIGIPILLIHGTADQRVPVKMALNLQQMFEESHQTPLMRICLIKGGNHLFTCSKHMNKLTNAVSRFTFSLRTHGAFP